MAISLKPKAVDKKPTISQHRLKRYLELQALVKEFAELEKELKQDLKDGLLCQPGPIVAVLKITERRNVAWKEEFIKECGQELADEILENAPKSSVNSLVVVDRNAGSV